MFKNKIVTSIAIVSLLAVTVLATTIAFKALSKDDASQALSPDYAPRNKEANAEPYDDGNSNKLEAPEGGGSVGLTYSTNVEIDLASSKASLFFANPYKSTQDMLVQIVIQDTVVVQSDVLAPGNQIKSLNLLEGAGSLLSQGVYEGKFVILYYDQESGEKAMVNTEIPLQIDVK